MTSLPRLCPDLLDPPRSVQEGLPVCGAGTHGRLSSVTPEWGAKGEQSCMAACMPCMGASLDTSYTTTATDESLM